MTDAAATDLAKSHLASSHLASSDLVTTLEQLEVLYGEAVPTSILKELPTITDPYRRYIEAAPFVAIATAGPEGLDCSPRGDPAPLARVLDERTVAIPDRRGNNRIDTLRNIVRDPRVALLFLIPGINETIRINGRATLTRDVALRQSFAMGDKVPATVIVVTVDSIYYQCPKALVRSKLWDPSSHVDPATLPSKGQIIQSIDASVDGAALDAAYPERLRRTIY